MGRTSWREKSSKGDVGGGGAKVLELGGGSFGGGEDGCGWRRRGRESGGEVEGRGGSEEDGGGGGSWSRSWLVGFDGTCLAVEKIETSLEGGGEGRGGRGVVGVDEEVVFGRVGGELGGRFPFECDGRTHFYDCLRGES